MLLREAREKLWASESPALDAELLLCFALSVPRTSLYSAPEALISEAQLARFDELLALRVAGKPLAYITGERDFWTLRLKLNSSTLVPRPETEHLIEQALELLSVVDAPRIADLGTGSGAIALALASELGSAQVIGTDVSEAALECARANAASLGIGNVEFRCGEWFSALADERFDLIVSNPPYIESEDPALAQPPLVFEPRAALDGGRDGLRDLRTLIAGAAEYLKPGSRLLLEHGSEQGEAVRSLFDQNAYQRIVSLRDLAGHERLTSGSV